MQIAIVIERMDPFRGGRETSTAQIAAELARRGQKVTVICRQGVWRCEGVELLALGRRGALRICRLKNFIEDVQKTLAGRKFDIVHSMFPLPGASICQFRGGTVPAQVLASKRKRSILGDLAVSLFEPWNFCRRKMGVLERMVAADSGTWCLAVSEMVAKELQEHYGRTQNVRVVYNAVDMPPHDSPERADHRQRLRFNLGTGPNDPVFLTVATNFELKGVAEAIEAFAEWYHSHNGQINGKLVVVGRDRPEGYERHAGLREIGSQVVFIGHSDHIMQWYAAADAFILLSWYDPCSRVVLEATRWGIPSITTAYNGAAEILAEGGGVVVESPKNRKQVVAAMDSLADAKSRAERSAACLKISPRLSIERHVDELLGIYEEILGQAGKNAKPSAAGRSNPDSPGAAESQKA
ncbi:MAG: glycosyltransferase family 4 protein [Planctomycetes bacterium]|nr:glycosyltransferase family 4 protein [Planctomycetota bacterium]